MAIQPFFIYQIFYCINYNKTMFKVDLVLNLLLLELISDFLLVKVFKIKIQFLYLLFLQLPKICVNIL